MEEMIATTGIGKVRAYNQQINSRYYYYYWFID